MNETIEVHKSDLEKVLDALEAATSHHLSRDDANAHLHLSKTVRHSPLTSELAAARDRVEALLEEAE